jgi:hypothetical protein
VITVSHFSVGEDFTGAALVVSSLGDPVLANRCGASMGAYLTLGDLATVLAPQRLAAARPGDR